MAEVKHVENEDGSHSIGVTLNRKFVPFVTVPAERVGQLVFEASSKKTAGKADTGEDET